MIGLRDNPIYRQPRPVPVITPTIGAQAVKRGLFVAKIYYFFFFGAIGCLVPFFNIYLSQIGLSGTEIGWLGSIAPIMALLANPFWGGVADRWQIHRLVLAFCALISGIVTLFFLQFNKFWPLLGLITALTFFRTPIGAILDSAVIDLVKRTGGHYGHQRMWGTVAFVLATLLLGQLVDSRDLSAIFWLHGGFLGIICMILSLFLPIESLEQKTSFGQGVRALLGQPNYRSFLIALTLLGVGVSAFVGFLGLHVLALGGSEKQVGQAWALATSTEILLMYFGGRWFARYSYRRVLLMSFAGFALVWGLVGLAPSTTIVMFILPGMGICFGSFWTAAVGYASEAAPPGLSATAQALMGAALSGLGWSLGSVAAGYLWDLTNGHTLFLFAGFTALLALVIFGLSSKPNP